MASSRKLRRRNCSSLLSKNASNSVVENVAPPQEVAGMDLYDHCESTLNEMTAAQEKQSDTCITINQNQPKLAT
jgi:hypothetical protein